MQTQGKEFVIMKFPVPDNIDNSTNNSNNNNNSNDDVDF